MMQVEFHSDNIAEIITDDTIINSAQEVLEIMVKPELNGARKIILHKENFPPEFYDLSTKLAGDILQKFVNYNLQVAIVGDFTSFSSESLKALIIEANRGNHIFFAENLEEAKQYLTKN